MNIGRIDRKAMCKGCRAMKDPQAMVHAWGHQLFCSKACVAKAQWTQVATDRKRTA